MQVVRGSSAPSPSGLPKVWVAFDRQDPVPKDTMRHMLFVGLQEEW